MNTCDGVECGWVRRGVRLLRATGYQCVQHVSHGTLCPFLFLAYSVSDVSISISFALSLGSSLSLSFFLPLSPARRGGSETSCRTRLRVVRWEICQSNRQLRTTTRGRSHPVYATPAQNQTENRLVSVLPFTHKTNCTKLVSNLNLFSKRVPRLCMVTFAHTYSSLLSTATVVDTVCMPTRLFSSSDPADYATLCANIPTLLLPCETITDLIFCDCTLPLGLTITMRPLTDATNAGDVPVRTNIFTTDTDLGTTDARFGADALGLKLEVFCSKAHTKAGTSCMSDSQDNQPFCDWSYPCHSTQSSHTFL